MALSDGLIACWSPWLGSSGYKLLDLTPFANHGTLNGMDAGTDWLGSSIRGKSGRFLDFDGSNDFVQAPAPVLSQITSEVTISTWNRLNSTGAATALFCAGVNISGSPPSPDRMQAHVPWSDNNIYWDFGGFTGNNRLAITGLSWNTTDWEHFVFQSTPYGLRCYRNGLLIGSTSVAVTRTASTSKTFDICRSNFGGTNNWYPGRIAECCAWNRAITAEEVRSLNRLGPGWYRPYAKRGYAYAAAAGFKAYWHRRETQLIGGGLK